MDYVDLVNQALQAIGTRTTVTQDELDDESTNEAIQANLIITDYRDRLLRMAPWNCARNYASLSWITAQPGTPENQSPAVSRWTKGLPPPPWVYEYQYPNDCLRPCFIIPQFQAGFPGVPLFPVSGGGGLALSSGPPIKYAVAIDQFKGVTAATIVNPGTGYDEGDFITLARGPSDEAPIGAPVVLEVATVGVGGAIVTLSVVSQVAEADPAIGGSYFAQQGDPQEQESTTGDGEGATFSLLQEDTGDQRVILTNQQDAVLSYIRQVTNVNVFDPLFQNAYVSTLAAGLAFALTGDKDLANKMVDRANKDIEAARVADGNEGLTVNDSTPDWIRIRGIDYPGGSQWSGNQAFDWGPLWSTW